MKDIKQISDNQLFIQLVEDIKKSGPSYTLIGKMSGLGKPFIINVRHNKSTADRSDIIKLLKAFPTFDKDLNFLVPVEEKGFVERVRELQQQVLNKEIAEKELMEKVKKLEAEVERRKNQIDKLIEMQAKLILKEEE